jgi:hypothetical protein
MLFRKNNGELVEIKKYDFTNDTLYYQKIMEIKKPSAGLTKLTNIATKNAQPFAKLKNFC